MSKAKETKPKAEKQPKTIKVSTVVTAVLVLIGLIAAFICGISYNEMYNSIVQAKAVELSSKLSQ